QVERERRRRYCRSRLLARRSELADWLRLLLTNRGHLGRRHRPEPRHQGAEVFPAGGLVLAGWDGRRGRRGVLRLDLGLCRLRPREGKRVLIDDEAAASLTAASAWL